MLVPSVNWLKYFNKAVLGQTGCCELKSERRMLRCSHIDRIFLIFPQRHPIALYPPSTSSSIYQTSKSKEHKHQAICRSSVIRLLAWRSLAHLWEIRRDPEFPECMWPYVISDFVYKGFSCLSVRKDHIYMAKIKSSIISVEYPD